MQFKQKPFRRCHDGNIAILAGLLAVPMVMLVAGGLDFAQYYRTQDSLQRASDAAVLAAFEGRQMRWGERIKRTDAVFHVNVNNRKALGLITTGLRGKRIKKKIVMEYSARAKLNSYFGKANPLTTNIIHVKSRAEATIGSPRGPRLLPIK